MDDYNTLFFFPRGIHNNNNVHDLMMTSVLASGTSLIVSDLFFDLRYLLATTPGQIETRRRQALEYYLFILRPRLSPYPFPGYFFVAICTFYLLVLVPSIQHYAMAICYIPICLRYREMLLLHKKGNNNNKVNGNCCEDSSSEKHHHHILRDWHYIVGIRLILLALGLSSLQAQYIVTLDV